MLQAIPPWYIRNTYEESTHHLYFLNLLNYWVIAFYLSALTQFRPIYSYERGVPGVCASHLDDLRWWFSGLWFGFDQHPMEADACLISAKLEHLSFFCFFFSRLVPIESHLSLPLLDLREPEGELKQQYSTVMQYVYPSHGIPIGIMLHGYLWGKTLCDREKPQINLSLNWGVLTIFLLVIVMATINTYKTPPDIPQAKSSEDCIYYCLCAIDSLKNS